MGAQHLVPVIGSCTERRSRNRHRTLRPRQVQSRKETIHNPLNDYLDEAQRDIDKNDFTAAITPLQKFIAEKPDVAYAHFQLAYAYTALKQVPEARAEYEKAISLDPKMTEAYLESRHPSHRSRPRRCRRAAEKNRRTPSVPIASKNPSRRRARARRRLCQCR